jgi:cytochrome d ubiquinol oxidase subunit I
MAGAAVTGAFAMAALGAYYLLSKEHEEMGKIFVRVGVISGLLFSLLVIGPTGDGQGRNLAAYQPAALAAMEAHFDTQSADLVILGQPNVENKTIDNPLVVPHLLSFLVDRDWKAQVRGLSSFPESEWPTNISLLYYAYHIMVGLGTIFMAVMLLCGVQLMRKKLFETRWLLWILMLSAPLPYIANTAGWMTAELGRQPYLIYGVLRTIDGYSKSVSAANVWFTLLGFMGMYTLIAILFLFLVHREIAHGPELNEGAVPAPVKGVEAFAGRRN